MDPSLRELLIALGDEPLEGQTCEQLSLFEAPSSSPSTPCHRP
jgi:hypothetical protein